MLSHFYFYVQEALVELGEGATAQRGMDQVHEYGEQIPAFHDVRWTCAPGLAQAAVTYYKLGGMENYERGNKIMTLLETLQGESGGFFGSYGPDAGYFPDEQISWAVKFYLDAAVWRIKCFFETQAHIFPGGIDNKDGRVTATVGALGTVDGKRVLDVGCGKGRFMRAIKYYNPGVRIEGTDLSAALLKDVPDIFPRREGSMLNLPYKDGEFDAVYSVEALEHCVFPENAIREMCRVLKPGGKIVIVDKDIAQWGTKETTPWEQWFDEKLIIQTLRKDCKNIFSNAVVGDNVFLVWQGVKMGEGYEEPKSSEPKNETSEVLSDKQWNTALVDSTPKEVANKVLTEDIPEWGKILATGKFIQKGNRVLELGSGTGMLSAYLATQGAEVHLLDKSKENLEFSREVFIEAGVNGTFHQHDVTGNFAATVGPKQFDVVWSSGLLEHFDDDIIAHILGESQTLCKSPQCQISCLPNW
jgi:ubiquinone/menaquinone biosynthesis C-methylase UbiE